MNDKNARKPNIGKWLFGIMLLWPIIVMLNSAIALAIQSQGLF
jgi:hypothetical protein